MPAFVAESALLRRAYAMALTAHHGPRRRGETDIDHPLAVAEVLFEYGISNDEVLAAALLHDVLEDTDTNPDEIGQRFGERIKKLVLEMTENAAIESYRERKAEHRGRVVRDRSVSAIYAADKLARSRDLQDAPEELAPERLEHYLATLRLLCDVHPELPYLAELRAELELLSERIAQVRM